MAEDEKGLHNARLPVFRGAFYMREHQGKIVLCAWPKKRPGKLSPKQSHAVELMREASYAVKRTPVSQIEAAKKLTHGTAALWRDVLFMGMYGTVPVQLVTDEGVIKSMVARRDVSQLLDGLGEEVGGILFRGDEYWIVLEPGEAGQVLTSQGGGGVEWAEGGGGGTNIQSTLLYRTTDQAWTSTLNYIPEFEAALYDDLSVWNPDEPDRLIVPTGASRVRLSAGIIFPGEANTFKYDLHFRQDDGSKDFPGNGRFSMRTPDSTSLDTVMQVQSAWLPAGNSAYYTMRLTMFGSRLVRVLTNSWAMMEAEF